MATHKKAEVEIRTESRKLPEKFSDLLTGNQQETSGSETIFLFFRTFQTLIVLLHFYLKYIARK